MTTLPEIKAAAATLSVEEQDELVTWLELRREIQIGLDELERGEFTEYSNETEMRSFTEGVKARGRELLAAQSESAA